MTQFVEQILWKTTRQYPYFLRETERTNENVTYVFAILLNLNVDCRMERILNVIDSLSWVGWYLVEWLNWVLLLSSALPPRVVCISTPWYCAVGISKRLSFVWGQAGKNRSSFINTITTDATWIDTNNLHPYCTTTSWCGQTSVYFRLIRKTSTIFAWFVWKRYQAVNLFSCKIWGCTISGLWLFYYFSYIIASRILFIVMTSLHYYLVTNYSLWINYILIDYYCIRSNILYL